jgi:hypothetical protein
MSARTHRNRSTPARTSRPSGSTTKFHVLRSIKMYSMHETLARDRMREHESRSRQARLARELAAARRCHRISLRARAAEARHANRVRRARVR